MRHIWARHSSTLSSFLRTTTVTAPRTSAPLSLSRSCQPASAVAVFRTKRGFQTHTTASPSVEEMETVNTTTRLAALRSLMKKNGVDIYGIPPSTLPIIPM